MGEIITGHRLKPAIPAGFADLLRSRRAAEISFRKLIARCQAVTTSYNSHRNQPEYNSTRFYDTVVKPAGGSPAGVFRRTTPHQIIVHARRRQHPTHPRRPNRVDRHLPSPTDETSNGAIEQQPKRSHV